MSCQISVAFELLVSQPSVYAYVQVHDDLVDIDAIGALIWCENYPH